jgi:Carboxypeptidase regulatory-like domain
MKMFTTAASILLVATIARGECVVIATDVRPSKQNAHITLTMNGKPAVRVPIRVEILSFASGKKSEMRLATDAHGAINLKDLPPGQSCLTTDVEPRLTASMCLAVTATHDKARTKFSLVLAPMPPPEPTLDDLAKQHDKSPIEFTAPVFVGTVKDRSGAGITKADIAVYRRGSMTKPDPLKLQADDEGNFTAPLKPGNYTIVVIAQGFKPRFVGVEIKRDAPEQDMSVELSIANDC